MKTKSWMIAAALVAAGAFGAAVALIATDAEEKPEIATVAVPDGLDAATGTGPASPIALDPDDVPLGRSEAAKVERAALRITGGGTISEFGRSDDPGEAYEVEVLTPTGEVDIALDDNLERVPNHSYDD